MKKGLKLGCFSILILCDFLSIPHLFGGSLAESEIHLYKKNGSRCKGGHSDQAAEVGFQKYNIWKVGRDSGKKSPPGAFRDAAQAFEFLVKSGCKDGLVLYRLGNIHRHNGRFKEAVDMINSALPDLKKKYVSKLNSVYSSLGSIYSSLGDSQKAITVFKLALKQDPNDVSSRINLSRRYYWVKQYGHAAREARYVLDNTPKEGLSSWGRGSVENNLGWINLDTGKNLQGIQHFKNALEARNHLFDVEGLAWAYEQEKSQLAEKYWKTLTKHFSSKQNPKLEQFLPKTQARFRK